MQTRSSLYLSMQISFEVVLETQPGPVDQHAVSLLKCTEFKNVVAFQVAEIKITYTNRVFLKCASLSTCVLVYADKSAVSSMKLFLNKRRISFLDELPLSWEKHLDKC